MANNTLTGFALAFATAVISSIILPVWSIEPKLLIYPRSDEFQLDPGENFTITCFVSSSNDSLTDDKISLMQWSTRNRTIVSGRNKILSGPWKNQLNLTINNISPVHRGTYQCSALYKGNQTLKTEVRLEVSYGKPYFINKHETVAVAKLSNVSFTCYAYGAHPMKYTWMDERGRSKTSKKGSPSASVTSYSSKLNFYGITSDENGEYSCSVTNKYGGERKIYKVEVTSRNAGKEPTFENNSENISVVEMSTLKILCRASGTQFMNYKWCDQNEQEIPPFSNSSTYISEASNGSLLIINNIKTSQSGSYMCSASNGYGMRSKVYRVNVIKGDGTIKQVLHIEDIKITEVTSSSVTLGIPPRATFDFIDIFYNYEKSYKGRKRVRWDEGDFFTLKDLTASAMYNLDFELSLPNIPILMKSLSVTLFPSVPEVIPMQMGGGNVILWIIWAPENIDMHQVTYELTYYRSDDFEGDGYIITTQFPRNREDKYKICGLESGKFYDVTVRAHTSAGFGEPYNETIYVS